MQMPFMNRRVLYLYILLVQWGILLHSAENVVRTEVAVAGRSINITCHFPSMDLSDVIVWVLNNNTTMEDESTGRRYATDRSGSMAYLEISNVTFEDVGFYKCIRYPKQGYAESKTNRLHVRGEMKVEVDRNFTLHDTITAKCCVRSTKSEYDVPFEWFISNVWSVNDKFEETISIDTDIMYCRNISITSERKFHENFFGCSISPELNVTSKKPLHIFYPASVEWIPLTNRPSPIMVNRNQNVIVTCLSDGNPSPSVLLQKKTSENQWMDLPFNETFWNVTDNYWKFSYYMTVETTCTLRCFATNDIGEPSASDVISIDVFAKANVIVITSRDTSGNAAKGYGIFCLAKGIPPPNVHLQRLTEDTEWRNHYVEEQQIERTEKGRNVLWTFHIVDKQYRDDVTYRCIANNTNDVFAHSSSTTLTVTKFDLTAVILANLKVVVIGCVGLLLLLMVICFLALKKRKRIRYRLSAEANSNFILSKQ
ncbi:uncharacterized protein [Apostichopus japonicus]|uniref:uncharacterized protein isoform X5 n=1 Tax=Stichopus japonicus TaxID=307972 RepID=UPI003AB42254